jgi:hypothetical protein
MKKPLSIAKIDFMQTVLVAMKLGPYARRDLDQLKRAGLRAVKLATRMGIVRVENGFVKFVGES